MSRTQEICDEIRTLVQSGDLALSPRFQLLAEEFAEVARETDARLRRCTDLLQRGLWVEAVHQANLAPRLLDEVAVLSFPDRHPWDGAVSVYGLPVAPVPDGERAAELNRAYVIQQSLESLTRKHRALARRRAAAEERLAVLRDLHGLDPDNPVWAEGIDLFEAEAYKHLAAEGERALARDDAYAIDAVYDRLTAPGWHSPPPMDLVIRLARRTLPLLCNRLEDALARHIRDRSHQVKLALADRLRAAALPDDAPAAARARDLIAHTEASDLAEFEAEEFNELLDRLTLALRDPATPPAEVKELYRQAVQYDAPLPRDVEDLYDRWEGRRTEKKDSYFTIFAICLFAVGVAGLLGFVVFMVSRR